MGPITTFFADTAQYGDFGHGCHAEQAEHTGAEGQANADQPALSGKFIGL